MSKTYDYLAVIGRFEPFHDGHQETFRKAFKLSKNVICIIGSSNAAPSPVNPLPAETRSMLIRDSVGHLIPAGGTITFICVEDRVYKESKWLQYIQAEVAKIVGVGTIALIGHEKDASSYYIKQNFKSWDFIETGPYIKESGEHGKVVSATKIRELMFENHLGYTEGNVPTPVYEFLQEYVKTAEFKALQNEYYHYREEEDIVRSQPYGVSYWTADSIVEQSGHILLVKRDELPGKGLWALPGTHVGKNETSDHASIRSIYQETGLKIQERILRGSVVETHIFEAPNRSLRARLTETNARTVSHAYHYRLSSEHPLPTTLKAGDGIALAWWFEFAEVKKMRNQLFEDHADVIDYFIG